MKITITIEGELPWYHPFGSEWEYMDYHQRREQRELRSPNRDRVTQEEARKFIEMFRATQKKIIN